MSCCSGKSLPDRDPEDLLPTTVPIEDGILRQTDIFSWHIAGLAVQHEQVPAHDAH